jgi:hypothetical protein
MVRSARRSLFALFGVSSLIVAQACASEPELNPQPLPPEDPTHAPEKTGGSDAVGSGTFAPPAANADAGTPHDASTDADTGAE